MFRRASTRNGQRGYPRRDGVEPGEAEETGEIDEIDEIGESKESTRPARPTNRRAPIAP